MPAPKGQRNKFEKIRILDFLFWCHYVRRMLTVPCTVLRLIVKRFGLFYDCSYNGPERRAA